MTYNTNQLIEEYQKRHRRRSAWRKVLAFLGCLVVFCVTYALILPAITKEHTAYCGIEEHTHSEEEGCYESVLICDQEERNGHVHSEECYEKKLVCQKEEHTHSTACFSRPDDAETDDTETNVAETDAVKTDAAQTAEGGENCVLTAEGADYTITVQYTEDAKIPEDTRLEVREILSGTGEYEQFATKAAEAMNEEEGEVTRRFFDITLLSGETEVEPAVPVNVTISLAEAQPTGQDTVVHFPDEGEVELIPATADADGVHYEQGSFSEVGVTANSSDIPAQDYNVRYQRNVTVNAIAKVGGTVTVSIVQTNSETGKAEVVSPTVTSSPVSNDYVNARYGGGVITITGLQETTTLTNGVTTVSLTYSVRTGTGQQARTNYYTININVLVTDEEDLSDLYTVHRYNHLEVKVDANFQILVYDTQGNMEAIDPDEDSVHVTEKTATVYHTRNAADDALTDSLGEYRSITPYGNNTSEQYREEYQVDNQTYGTTIGYMWDLMGDSSYSDAVSNYSAATDYNGQTVKSYQVVFNKDSSTDTTTGDEVYKSIGQGKLRLPLESSSGDWDYSGRHPLAIYDGDTVEVDMTISYKINGQTYTADYTVAYVVNHYFNLCPYDDPVTSGVSFGNYDVTDAYRGLDIKIDVQDIVEIAPTYVQKVDQYGDPVANAKMAVYATDSDYNYYYYIDQAGENPVMKDGSTTEYATVDLTSNTISDVSEPDPVTGVIRFMKDGATYYIVPRDTGVTDDKGQYTWVYDNTSDYAGVTMTMSSLRELIGSDHFIMREIDIPDGYRTVSDEIKLKFSGSGQTTVITCENSYQSGVWASANAHVEATETLYTVDAGGLKTTNEDGTVTSSGKRNINYYSVGTDGTMNTDGTLFAVVLKRNGESLENIDNWHPVSGNDSDGYKVSDTGGLSAVVTAAKAGNVTEFTKSSDGRKMTVNLTDLPGDVTRYYTYMQQLNGGELLTDSSTGVSDTEPQYFVAYYWTPGSLADASDTNTYRVISRSGILNGETRTVTNEDGTTATVTAPNYSGFSIQWGTTIEVPNFENRLYVQKLDESDNLVENATFALYEAMDAPSQTSSETRYVYYKGTTSETGSGGEEVYVALLTPSETIPYKAAVFRKTDVNGAAMVGYARDYKIDESTGKIEVTVGYDKNGEAISGVTYYVFPATDAEGNTLISTTHDNCSYVSEKGTAHFLKLKEGQYYLREISAPAGYSINTTDIPVLVNENGVYAYAGAEENQNGVSVGNGIGYLTKTLDVFGSIGDIDETLSWVYATLLHNNTSGFAAFDNISDDVIHIGDAGNTWKFVIQSDGAPDGYGSGTSTDISKAMVTYLQYNGALSKDENRTTIFDYTPTDDQSGRTGVSWNNGTYSLKDGENTVRLWVNTGWSDLAIYQDYTYGSTHRNKVGTGENAANATQYTDLTSYGNISNLFSSSTFVQVSDEQIVTDASVDIALNKVAKDDPSKTLEGAAFQLYKLDTDGKKLYYQYTPGTDAELNEDGTEKTPAVAAKTEWVAESDKATTLTTADTIHLLSQQKDAMTETTFYLVETDAPSGYQLLAAPVEITVEVKKNTDQSLTVDVTMSYGGTKIYPADADLNDGFSAEETYTSVANKNENGTTAGFIATYLYTITIPNSSGYELPHTGGSGTIWYTIAGMLLILSGITWLMYRYSKKGERRGGPDPGKNG